MIKRLFPAPVLSCFLLVIWLIINQTVAPSQILLGVVLGILGPWLTRETRPFRVHVRRPVAALRLMGRVAVDIVRSNLQVAAIILGHRRRSVESGFMHIPLKMRDPHALAALGCIITGCPGTVWAGLTEDCSTFTIHVLDLRDENEWIDIVQNRYETLLMEIFESGPVHYRFAGAVPSQGEQSGEAVLTTVASSVRAGAAKSGENR